MIQYDVGKILMEYYNKPCSHKNNPENTRVAVAIETRDSFFFPLVIKNFCDKLGPKWNIHLFITTKVKQQIENLLPDCKFQISIITHPVRFHIENFSMLLRSDEFWMRIKEEKVLVFQSDCISLKPYQIGRNNMI